MKINKVLTTISFILFILQVSAQNVNTKFGSVNQKDFEISIKGSDSSAAAIKLFDIGETYFEYNNGNGFVIIFERHTRYKIINKSAYDLGNIEVPLYKSKNGKQETLLKMDATSYNLEDGNIKSYKITKDSKFTENYNQNYQIKKYALNNIKEGSIIEYKYKIVSPFIFNLKGWNFQGNYPTIYSEFNVKIPQFYSYKVISNGFKQHFPVKNELINSHMIPGYIVGVKQLQYIDNDIPSLKEEPFITSLDDYRSGLSFELISTVFPDQERKDYTGTWPSVIKTINEDVNFGKFLEKNSFSKNLITPIIGNETDQLKVISKIFNFVKSSIKWNKEYSLYTSDINPKNILEKRSGNSADINLLLYILLTEAKIQVNPVLISTRANGIHPGVPQLTKFNSVVLNASINGNTVLLDAINPDHYLGMLSYDNLNHEGLLVDLKNKNGEWISTEPSFISEKLAIYNLNLDADGSIQGSVQNYKKGFASLQLRSSYRQSTNEEEYLKTLLKGREHIQISNYKFHNLDNYSEYPYEEYEINIENAVDRIGDVSMLFPILHERSKENIFKSEERLYPVDFGYLIKETLSFYISYPNEWEINSLPKNQQFQLPNNMGTFSMVFADKDKNLSVKSVISINSTVFKPEQYFEIKEFFGKIVEKQAEQVIFKKVK